MKLLLSLFIAAAVALTVFATPKDYKPTAWKLATIDSPAPPKYWIHYSLRIDTTTYMRSVDTALIVNDLLGKTLTYEQAVFWKQAHYRSLARIDQALKKDTLKIQGGRK